MIHHHQGYACAVCSRTLVVKQTGRKRRFCSDHCRDRARQDRNYAFRGTVGGLGSGVPRNAGNFLAISNGCKPVLAGRGYVNPQLWHAIVEVEVFAGRDWLEVVSTDGVRCLVAVLRPRALREVLP
jgi:hypothetical protein